jgi:ribosomal protein S18 acetylase RimI-like enzyme
LAVIDLLLASRAAGRVDHWPTVSILRRILCRLSASEAVELTRLWVGHDSALAGFATLSLAPGYLLCLTLPDVGDSFQGDILDWATETAAQTKDPAVERATLQVQVRDQDDELIGTLERRDFVRRDWFTHRMTRRLDEPIPEPRLPPGFTIRPLEGEQEQAAWLAMRNDAFGSTQTTEWRQAVMRDPEYRADLDLVVVAPDGTLAAFCQASIDLEENRRNGTRQGWTDPIGTSPAFRRMGLARAVTLAALHRLKDRAMAVALLGTASDNVGAYRLYESLGFRTISRILAYERPI